MGLFDPLLDWVRFRTMVTPLILKVFYQILFIILNLIGIASILGVVALGILGALTQYSKDSTIAILSLLGALVFALILTITLLLYNLGLRVYFEVILLVFNVYDELKAINGNTKKK